MKKLVLALTPLLAVSFLTNCNSDAIKSRIDRVKYTEITENVPTKSFELLQEIRRSQIENTADVFNRLILPRSGSINTTVEAAIKGSMIKDELHLKNLNVSLNTKYGMSWNLDKHFIEFNSDGKSWYVAQYPGFEDVYYSAHSYFIDGVEIKEKTLIPFFKDSFEEYLRDSLANRALFLTDMELGMSGFGYVPNTYIYEAYPSVSGLFNSESGVIYELYDFVNKYAGQGHNLNYQVAANGQGTFSGNLNANLNLKQLKDTIRKDMSEEDRRLADIILALGLNGTLNFDLFIAWANNYVCQQEYIIKGKNLDVSGGIGGHFFDIKGNVNIYFGEEASTSYDISEEKIKQILDEYKSPLE